LRPVVQYRAKHPVFAIDHQPIAVIAGLCLPHPRRFFAEFFLRIGCVGAALRIVGNLVPKRLVLIAGGAGAGQRGDGIFLGLHPAAETAGGGSECRNRCSNARNHGPLA